jgi:hypothetical protein
VQEGADGATTPWGAHTRDSAWQVSPLPQSASPVQDRMHISGADVLATQVAPEPHGHGREQKATPLAERQVSPLSQFPCPAGPSGRHASPSCAGGGGGGSAGGGGGFPPQAAPSTMRLIQIARILMGNHYHLAAALRKCPSSGRSVRGDPRTTPPLRPASR